MKTISFSCALLLSCVTGSIVCTVPETNTSSLKKNLMTLLSQQYEQILSYNVDDREEADVIDKYKKITRQTLETMTEAVNALTDEHAQEVNAFLKNTMMNPQPKYQEYGIKCGSAVLKIGKKLEEGKTITKEMIREEFSFVPEFSKKEVNRVDTELTDLIVTLLEKQNNSYEIANKVKKATQKSMEYAQNNSEVICNFAFESMVDLLHESFQSTENLIAAGQKSAEYNKEICNEVGVSQEELIQANSDALLASINNEKQEN